MSVVDQIRNHFSPAIITRLANGLGLPLGPTQRAVAAAVPAIVSGLVTMARTRDGANDLGDAVRAQDPHLLRNYQNYLTSSAQAELINDGGDTLNMLLGAARTSDMAAAISKYTGLEGSQSGAVLAAVTPVVLGQLAHMRSTHSLDEVGLAGLIASEERDTANAMPKIFSRILAAALPQPKANTNLSPPFSGTPSNASTDRSHGRHNTGGRIVLLGLVVALAIAAAYVMSPNGPYNARQPAPPVAPPNATP